MDTAFGGGSGGRVDSPVDLEVECFVQGQMYHIDGLVLGGKLKICWPSCYVNTVVDFEQNGEVWTARDVAVCCCFSCVCLLRAPLAGFIAGYSLSPEDKLVKPMQEFVWKV